MYYHAVALLADQWDQIWINRTRDDMIKDVLLPFIHGQVVAIPKYTGDSWLISFRAARLFFLYKTEEKIDDYSDPRSIGEECTNEFLNEVKALQLGPNLTSILQKSLAPVLNQVFVIMKFGDKILDSAYEGVIKPVAQEFGLITLRIDEVRNSGKITDQVLESLAASRFVLADLSGERPNCYYETGFAHALGKELILTIQSKDVIHFDLIGYRFIQWETEAELRRELRSRFNSLMNSK